ncbi:MAG TPA: hypothetical protein DCW53_04830, partial [Rikenellaceae bacterium]|nr:hypothetical protein [Rikenellaceae bacterium]
MSSEFMNSLQLYKINRLLSEYSLSLALLKKFQMKLLFATANKGKLREAKEILGDTVQILSPSELGINADIEESGDTLKANSILKAEALFRISGMDCFADDTGLEVDALNG